MGRGGVYGWSTLPWAPREERGLRSQASLNKLIGKLPHVLIFGPSRIGESLMRFFRDNNLVCESPKHPFAFHLLFSAVRAPQVRMPHTPSSGAFSLENRERPRVCLDVRSVADSGIDLAAFVILYIKMCLETILRNTPNRTPAIAQRIGGPVENGCVRHEGCPRDSEGSSSIPQGIQPQPVWNGGRETEEHAALLVRTRRGD